MEIAYPLLSTQLLKPWRWADNQNEMVTKNIFFKYISSERNLRLFTCIKKQCSKQLGTEELARETNLSRALIGLHSVTSSSKQVATELHYYV